MPALFFDWQKILKSFLFLIPLGSFIKILLIINFHRFEQLIKKLNISHLSISKFFILNLFLKNFKNVFHVTIVTKCNALTRQILYFRFIDSALYALTLTYLFLFLFILFELLIVFIQKQIKVIFFYFKYYNESCCYSNRKKEYYFFEGLIQNIWNVFFIIIYINVIIE